MPDLVALAEQTRLEALERANVRWARKLGHGIQPAQIGASSWADVEVIRKWQGAHGLVPDGIFGPKSAALWLDRYGWRGTPGMRATHRHSRVNPPSPWSIVIHDTVSHTAASAFRTLEGQGYATHFFVEQDGTILESLDPATEWGAHAGAFNQESIGLDMVHILDPVLANPVERSRLVRRAWSAKGGRHRGWVVDYTMEQKTALVDLVEMLCERFTIPRVIPTELTTYGEKVMGITDRTYHGVIAHAQWSTKRWDGLLGAELLLAAGFEPWKGA